MEPISKMSEKGGRMKLMHKDGRRVEVKNFRPIAIISVLCKRVPLWSQ